MIRPGARPITKLLSPFTTQLPSLLSSNQKIGGVCGGLANYFEVDPVLVRLMFVGAGFLTGVVPGLLAYVVGWIIVPQAGCCS